MENLNVNLASQIRLIRELQGFSQESLASFLGISQQAYQKMESGKCRICKSRLLRIAEFFDIDAKLLLQFDKRDFLNYVKFKSAQEDSTHHLLKQEVEAIRRELITLKQLSQQVLKELS